MELNSRSARVMDLNSRSAWSKARSAELWSSIPGQRGQRQEVLSYGAQFPVSVVKGKKCFWSDWDCQLRATNWVVGGMYLNKEM